MKCEIEHDTFEIHNRRHHFCVVSATHHRQSQKNEIKLPNKIMRYNGSSPDHLRSRSDIYHSAVSICTTTCSSVESKAASKIAPITERVHDMGCFAMVSKFSSVIFICYIADNKFEWTNNVPQVVVQYPTRQEKKILLFFFYSNQLIDIKTTDLCNNW